MKLAFLLFDYFPFGGLQRDCLKIARRCAARTAQPFGFLAISSVHSLVTTGSSRWFRIGTSNTTIPAATTGRIK